jgi:DNA helicase-2/ATP-dependent DNA helicase PcrA
MELRKLRHQLKDIAILYRANYLSGPIEKSLINSGINYVIFGGVKFFQRMEIKDVISYLKILNNYDEFAFKRMINTPKRKIGQITIKNIEKFALFKNKTLYKIIVENLNELPISNLVKKELVKFINLINKYKFALKNNSIHLVLSNFLKEINYLSI